MPDSSLTGAHRDVGGQGDPAGVPAQKAVTRQRLLDARRTASRATRERAARRVGAVLADLVRRLAPALASGYLPFSTEPGGADLPDTLLAAMPSGGRLLLPVLRDDLDLEWAEYNGPASLRVDDRGRREPAGARLGVDAIAPASLLVVPAVAVDRRGVRLGRGGGSFDRALARVRDDALTVAVLHDWELVERLPAEPHDRRIRAVVTPERGLLRLR